MDRDKFSKEEGKVVQLSLTDSNVDVMDQENDSHANHPVLEPNVENAERAKC